MQRLNKYMTWEQAVEQYPGQWIAFAKDCKRDWGGDPVEGTVVAVCSDDEIGKFRVACYDKGEQVYCNRTSVCCSVGVLDVQGIKIEIE